MANYVYYAKVYGRTFTGLSINAVDAKIEEFEQTHTGWPSCHLIQKVTVYDGEV